ncbi:MAG TPA: RluA family pseudouridine synthase [Clostridiales bacterium]|nr:MAG: Ribosomal large subunit pseudouridine synthase D [Firmicutes bacterium ADurb.Bin262]HOU11266.1 RluA family pseudouridine synthase [Clostridiales bacterium]HQK73976.1 RluA family pseudouridine synthase [Clostridiales bacterium]
MPRVLTFKVPAEYDNKKVVHVLRGEARLSSRLVNSLKRTDGAITLNGSHIRTVDTVRAGDTLAVTIPDDAVCPEPFEAALDVLYEDEDVLVVNKSPDIAVHPSHNHLGNTLANAVSWHLSQQGKSASFRCIGRLDKGTSGALVCALNRFAAARLTGGVQKSYLAAACGRLEGSGVIDEPIIRPDPMKTKRACAPGGEKAVTRWEALGGGGGVTLLRVTLETGRTHQIRVHFAHLGMPLAGDTMYGDAFAQLGRQMLHCEQAVFTHPVTGEPLRVHAPLPADMADFLLERGIAAPDAESRRTAP